MSNSDESELELVQLNVGTREGHRGDVVAVTAERAIELFDQRAATAPRGHGRRAPLPPPVNPLVDDSPDAGRLDWSIGEGSPDDEGDVPDLDLPEADRAD